MCKALFNMKPCKLPAEIMFWQNHPVDINQKYYSTLNIPQEAVLCHLSKNVNASRVIRISFVVDSRSIPLPLQYFSNRTSGEY